MNMHELVRTSVASSVFAAVALAQAPTPRFGPPDGYPVTGARANGYVLLADVNGDGLLDAVISDLVDGTIKVMLQQAGGVFAAPVDTHFTSPFLNSNPAYALADLNEDGLADIVAGARAQSGLGTPNISVRFGSPGGQFVNQLDLSNQPGTQFPAGTLARGIALADVNHDGHVDIISSTNGASGMIGISVMLGDGAGGFGTSIESGHGGAYFMLIGDVNGDGNADAVALENTGTGSFTSSAAYINFGDGLGHFSFVGTQTFNAGFPTSGGNSRCFLQDVDGDGLDDLVVFGFPGGQSGGGGIYVRRSNGNGTFTQTFQETNSSISTMLLVDLDGDSRPDIVKLTQYAQGNDQILMNDGAGGFATSSSFPNLTAPFEARDATAGQLRGSPLQDLVVMGVNDNPGEMNLFVYENAPAVLPPLPYCFGDGYGTHCPCFNTGSVGNGCSNSLHAAGANLSATGNASVAADTLILSGIGMPDSSALYFQGTAQFNGGLGSAFGDGLRCVDGSVIRLGTKSNSGSQSSYPQVGDQPISVRGAIPAAGATRTYQIWYRNAASYCTSETFNLSNGLQIVWTP